MTNNIEKFEERLADQVRNRWTNYQKKRISLTSARSNELFSLAGAYICVEDVSDKDVTVTIRLNKDTNDELDLVNGVEIETLFGQFYISNAAQAGEWLDLIIGADFKYKKKAEGGGLTYIDRGDIAIADFDVADYTIDSAWHDLDLSGIIDPGAVLVLIRMRALNTLAYRTFKFRQKDFVNEINTNVVYTQAASVGLCVDLLVRPNKNGVVQYWVHNSGTWQYLTTVIRGWFIE